MCQYAFLLKQYYLLNFLLRRVSCDIMFRAESSLDNAVDLCNSNILVIFAAKSLGKFIPSRG